MLCGVVAPCYQQDATTPHINVWAFDLVNTGVGWETVTLESLITFTCSELFKELSLQLTWQG